MSDILDIGKAATGDSDQLRKAQHGEVAAFKELCKPHLPGTYTLCHQVCGHSSGTEELTKQIFIRCWESLTDLNDGGQFIERVRQETESILWAQLRRNQIPNRNPSEYSREKFSELLDEFTSQADIEAVPRSVWHSIQGYVETEELSPIEKEKELKAGRRRTQFLSAAMLSLILLFVVFLAMPSEEISPQEITNETPAVDTSQLPPRVQELQQEYGVIRNEVLGNLGDEAIVDDVAQKSMADDLTTVDQTIDEITVALQDEPENEMLEQMLVSTYIKQIKLLRKAASLFD